MLETIGLALQSLRGNGLRSALTLLGMAIGVFSVIASVTAVKVLESTLVDSLAALGAQTITITRINQDRPSTDEEEGRRPLTFEQSERLRDRAPLAASVSAMTGRGGLEVRAGDQKTDPNVRLTGVDQDYLTNNGLEIAEGRFLSEDDVRSGRAVTVLGSSVREKLLGGRDAVGQEVRVDGRRYTVIGVMAERSGSFGIGDNNNLLWAPITRVISAYNLGDEDVTIQVRAPSAEMLAATRDQAVGVLRAVRRLTPEEDNTFEVSTSEDAIGSLKTFTNALAMGGAGVGLIALLAAGVGVMNIMLVSVTERTREIGIRKALGATRKDIMLQFLVEAIVLCQLGGLVGLLVGVAGGNIAAALMSSAPAFPVGWAIFAIIGVTVVALTFGVYPATKAARLHPIDALRSE